MEEGYGCWVSGPQCLLHEWKRSFLDLEFDNMLLTIKFVAVFLIALVACRRTTVSDIGTML